MEHEATTYHTIAVHVCYCQHPVIEFKCSQGFLKLPVIAANAQL